MVLYPAGVPSSTFQPSTKWAGKADFWCCAHAHQKSRREQTVMCYDSHVNLVVSQPLYEDRRKKLIKF